MLKQQDLMQPKALRTQLAKLPQPMAEEAKQVRLMRKFPLFSILVLMHFLTAKSCRVYRWCNDKQGGTAEACRAQLSGSGIACWF